MNRLELVYIFAVRLVRLEVMLNPMFQLQSFREGERERWSPYGKNLLLPVCFLILSNLHLIANKSILS